MIRRLFIALAVLAAPAALAQDAPASADVLAEANALYREGRFAEAADRYREALADGLDGPRIHYNLGNALYRSDELGAAIGHYHLALRMAPRDADIRANLERALAERPAGTPAPSPSWLHAAGSRVIGTFTLSEFAAFAAVCWWIAAAGLVALLIGAGPRRTVTRVAIVFGVLALTGAGLATARWWSHHHLEHAVVVAESAQMRTGPGESFEVARSVQEGWLLRVLRRDANWAEVVGEAGATGWMPVSALDLLSRQTSAERITDG
jgi:tetratricopeptide (TPR) repeat protein